ncbi:hypothetical protein C4K14_3743 [Pseudomonas chlororaphis subsp. aureofaciens]|uniref:hypothetical protein n=1 Tax=Pseudomonas chlororaphis TaxID=587753 RepID=UPI000F5732ED|nr:hypothetical protein [Pseudomonas chlororaphis]AZD84965.1 hypothetical protein C4K14_2131 [Pseudomonas chlororaphis subsp. aureofaciens]AZD86567.1 hypothetical protein C4K14_3743 [Pseudomonas chlororaphis subsp. aureofaciens]
MSDFIYEVNHLVRDDDMSICCRCPHCQNVIGIEGEEFDDVCGEQYQCRCGGWLEVSYSPAVLKRGSELPENKGVPDDE